MTTIAAFLLVFTMVRRDTLKVLRD